VNSAVIIDAVRTPIGRGRPGGAGRPGGQLSSVHPVNLLAQTFRALMDRNDVDPGLVDDVVVGCVSQVGEQAATPGRWAWLAAGLPEHVPAVTIDRRCGSGQQAIDYAAQAIIAGAYDIAVAGGVESMSRVPMLSARLGQDPYGSLIEDRYGSLVSQGTSAEIVAADFDLNRGELDAYAVRSHQRAARAARSGAFDREIVPVTVPTQDGGHRLVGTDETIRPDANLDDMTRLRPAFYDQATATRFPAIRWAITAGNSSQISDGAAAVLVMSEQRASALGLHPRARFHSFALAAADPIRMLTGPIPATEKVLKRAGLALDEIDHYEVNEAFASVPMAWQRHFDADDARINPRGGAIALGHPLGASGARLMTTMLNALESGHGRYGLQTMCEGGGMANATIIERYPA
jgi:acetyl-CoA acetyltransferase family protein